MPGNLRDFKPGEILNAGHINELNKRVRGIRPPLRGSYSSGVNTSIGAGALNHPPWNQHVFRVTGKAKDENDVVIPDVYMGHIKWYSFDDEEWKPTEAEFVASLQIEEDTGNPDPDKRKEWKVDASPLLQIFDVGDIIIVYWDEQRATYVPCAAGSHLQYFELKTDLAPGGQATAYPKYWDHLLSEWKSDYDSTISVLDILGIHRGRGREKFLEPNEDGSFGRAVKHTITNQWHIVDLQPTALWLRATIDANFLSADSYFAIQSDPVICFPVGGVITDQDPAFTIVVYNPNRIWGIGGDDAEVKWNDILAQWEIVIAYSEVIRDVITNVYCEDGEIVVCTTKTHLLSPNSFEDEVCP